MPATLVTLAAALALAPTQRGEPPAKHDLPVGGYEGLDSLRGREPPDGQDKLIAAYILLPLGTIATATAAAGVWLTQPGHCADRLPKIGLDGDPGQCKGLFVLNVIRVSYGSLMIVTGGVLLGLGLRERERHRKWERGSSWRVTPWAGRHGGGVGLVFRF
jgi:hypothetical protein